MCIRDRLVEDLLELSRLENSLPQDDSEHVLLTLEDLVDSAWGSIGPIAEERRVTLQLDRSESGPLRGDQRRLHRAVLNLSTMPCATPLMRAALTCPSARAAAGGCSAFVTMVLA